MDRALTCILLILFLLEMIDMCCSASLISFVCGDGVCNSGKEAQYCDTEDNNRCVLCEDVEYTCFKPSMKINCSSHCLDKPCPKLGNVPNGHHNGTDIIATGSVINVTCKEGYHVIGSPTITCLQFGIWSGNLSQCERKTCGPPVLEHGQVQSSVNTTVGSVAEYMCDEGYKGADTKAICTNNGTWDPLDCTRVDPLNVKFNSWMIVALSSMILVIIIIAAILIFFRYVHKVYKEYGDYDIPSNRQIRSENTECDSENPLITKSTSASISYRDEITPISLAEDNSDFPESNSTYVKSVLSKEKEQSHNIHLTFNIGGKSSTTTIPIKVDSSDSARVSENDNEQPIVHEENISVPVQVSDNSDSTNSKLVTANTPHYSTNREYISNTGAESTTHIKSSEQSDCLNSNTMDLKRQNSHSKSIDFGQTDSESVNSGRASSNRAGNYRTDSNFADSNRVGSSREGSNRADSNIADSNRAGSQYAESMDQDRATPLVIYTHPDKPSDTNDGKIAINLKTFDMSDIK